MGVVTALRCTVRRVRIASCADGASTTGGRLHRDRRALLKAVLGLGLAVGWRSTAVAEDPKAARPQNGDRFVFAVGDRVGQTIKAEDGRLGGPQQLVCPMDRGFLIMIERPPRNPLFLYTMLLRSRRPRICDCTAPP